MTDPLSLARIHFRAGAQPGSAALSVDGSRAIVIVGPNNAGKSLALRELETWSTGTDVERLVIQNVEVEWPSSFEEAMELLGPYKARPPSPIPEGHIWASTTRPGQQPLQLQIDPANLRTALEGRQEHALRPQLLQPNTVRLDGRGRFALADPQSSGDLQEPAQNHLWRLLQDDPSRERVRKLVSDAFGLYFFVDGTAMQHFRIRMSSSPPAATVDELSFGPEAREFAAQAPILTDLGDGVQAFTGLISAIVSLPSRLILIDEPEAFLHPVLSRRLGSNLVELAGERAGTLVVATHSADFLMGCIESSPETTVVRLTYDAGVGTARALPSDQLSELMHNPLLRSTGALTGLFHRAVVITEADNDRAFYSEINRRLARDDRGITDCHFVNAQNWQTTARIMTPLRKLGIPSAVIVDLDALAAGQSWAPFFRAMGLDEATRRALGEQKARCAAHLKSVGKEAYLKNGLAALGDSERNEVQAFLDLLESDGLFVVPVGAVEGWLSSLGVPGEKTTWAINMLERLGPNPESADWVHPDKNDVWEFLDRIANWVDDPARAGIP